MNTYSIGFEATETTPRIELGYWDGEDFWDACFHWFRQEVDFDAAFRSIGGLPYFDDGEKLQRFIDLGYINGC